ncbi:hypothetical protein [Alkalicoccobacillus porphyridii]|nr:hypothetical protein [Alkalicoccobacillus porphyridii]
MDNSFKSGALLFIVVIIFGLFAIGAGKDDDTAGSDVILTQ